MHDKSANQILLQIFSSEQQILQRSDQKAFTLLSMIGVFSVFFIVHYTQIKPNVLNLVFFTLYFVMVFISIIQLMLVIAPRIKMDSTEVELDNTTLVLTFFGGIAKLKSAKEYAAEIESVLGSRETMTEVFSRSIYNLGRINAYKNKYLRRGIIYFLLSLFCELAIILSLFIEKLFTRIQ
jgi:hypothetical protein